MIENRAQVVVVGAGLSGLAVACQLVESGCDVVVLEREDRVGGRIHDGLVTDDPRTYAEFGLAYFSASADHALVKSGVDSGFLLPLGGHPTAASGQRDESVSHPCWYGPQGLTAWCVHEASKLKVYKQACVTAIIKDGRGCVVQTKDQHWRADAVVLTPPVPVWLPWVNSHQGSSKHEASLRCVSYTPSLVLSLVAACFEADAWVAWDRAAKIIAAGPIASIFAHHAFGPARVPVYSVQISAEFSRVMHDAAPETIINALRPALSGHLTIDIGAYQVHRWTEGWSQRPFVDDNGVQHALPVLEGVFWTGDGFYGGGVANVLRAAESCARAIFDYLS